MPQRIEVAGSTDPTACDSVAADPFLAAAAQELDLPSIVTLEAEVPEVLFRGMRAFIDAHPHWDQYSVIRSALAGFLFQNGCQEQTVTQHYLDGLFLRP